MQEIALSNATLHALSTSISNEVCNRIGDAIIQTGWMVGTVGACILTIDWLQRRAYYSRKN